MAEIRVSVPDEVDRYLESVVRGGMFGNKAEILRSAVMQFMNAVGPISRGFDTENIFSPEGRLYQIEYAREASNNGSTAVGVVCEDGVMLVAVNPANDRLLVNVEKFQRISQNVVLCSSGLVIDGAMLADELRRCKFKDIDEILTIVRRFFWQHVINKNLRPLGVQVLVGCHFDRPRLFVVDVSGAVLEVKGWTIGKKGAEMNEELSKKYKAMKIRDAEKFALGLLGRPDNYYIEKVVRK
ncbi:MAG: hypothetical protein HZB92_03685 [Euryarchaeota archaeon]|nr:hypothetical protein [Euryarchaeota archaeon]